MTGLLKILFELLVWLGFLLAAGWVARRVLQRSEDPPALLFRLVLTALNGVFIYRVVGPIVAPMDAVSAYIGIPLAAVAGAVMALIWVPSLADTLGRWCGTLYDGGAKPPDPEPFLSIAEARRKQGRYAEAIAALREQLERFPHHFRTQMLLAEIQAEDLRDLPAAAATVETCLRQPGHPPKNIAFALLRLAEWQLKLSRDREAARATLERILELLPGTPEAHLARQRLAHLPPEEMLRETGERPRLAVPASPERLGLLGESPQITPRDSDPEQRVARLVAQLDQHPEDNHSREELALLYSREFQRPDLAAEQLEQLIAQPHAPPAQIVRWLNLLADVHLDGAGDLDAARQALQRVVDLAPGAPAAEQARRRLVLLQRQRAAKKPSPALKPVSADPRLGLKSGPPQRA